MLFLDYIGLPELRVGLVTRLVAGMADYLEACGCILAGGETAEMPGLVPPGAVELAGFCIGCVEKDELVTPSSVREGDVLVGYGSAGIHANGWSLVRRVMREHPGEFTEEDVEALTQLRTEVLERYVRKYPGQWLWLHSHWKKG